MTDLQMMIMADRLLRVCGELQTMCKELMAAEPTPGRAAAPVVDIPEFIRVRDEDDLPPVKPPRCTHGVLFSEPCEYCAENNPVK